MNDFQGKRNSAEHQSRRQYFWRAANACRRIGLKRSAIVIAENIDSLVDALERPKLPRSKTLPLASERPRRLV